MAKEEKPIGLGEISTIRDILMGQQIAEYQEKFDIVKAREEQMELDFNNKIEALEKDVDARFNSLEKEMGARFDKLEKLLKDSISDLDGKLDNVSKSDKETLGQMLQQMGEKLMNGKAK